MLYFILKLKQWFLYHETEETYKLTWNRRPPEASGLAPRWPWCSSRRRQRVRYTKLVVVFSQRRRQRRCVHTIRHHWADGWYGSKLAHRCRSHQTYTDSTFSFWSDHATSRCRRRFQLRQVLIFWFSMRSLWPRLMIIVVLVYDIVVEFWLGFRVRCRGMITTEDVCDWERSPGCAGRWWQVTFVPVID